MAFLGLDLKGFAIQVFGGLIGGWLSEVAVKYPEIAGVFGKYATPAVGAIAGLLGQYLGNRGILPREIAQLIEYGGSFTVGNWLWEFIKTGMGGSSGAGAVTVYIPPVEVEKRQAIVL